MIKEINYITLARLGACPAAIIAFGKYCGPYDTVSVVSEANRLGRLDWANWLLPRCMDKTQYVLS